MSWRLADPWMLLWLLPLAAVVLWARRSRRGPRPAMRYSARALVAPLPPTLRSRLVGLPAALLIVAAVLMVFGLARPQGVWGADRRAVEGIDIMLVIDVSDSMRAMDFTPNRLEQSKAVIREFIRGRTSDRIGIVIFARETFTLCPLTTDYRVLESFVDRIDFGLIAGDATAIGMGLANAVNKLRRAPGRSRVAILLTDGENNAGQIDPLSAAEIARQFGVRVYTIGVGTAHGTVPFPNPSPMGPPVIPYPSQLDVEQLTAIARMTGGQFFHATDNRSLEQIYHQIDRMERSRVDLNQARYLNEWAPWVLAPAMALMLLALALESTWLRTYP